MVKSNNVLHTATLMLRQVVTALKTARYESVDRDGLLTTDVQLLPELWCVHCGGVHGHAAAIGEHCTLCDGAPLRAGRMCSSGTRSQKLSRRLVRTECGCDDYCN